MTLVFFDSFGYCADGVQSDPSAGDDLGINWSSWQNSPSIGSFGASSQGSKKYIQSNSTTGNWVRSKSFPAVGPSFVFGARVYLPTLARMEIARFGSCFQLAMKGDGTWGIAVDSNYTITWGTSHYATVNLTTGWQYIEIEVTLSTSATGSISFYRNGTLDSTLTNVQTSYSGTSFTSFALLPNVGGITTENGQRIADVYLDTDTVQGPCECYYQAADTAGSASNFTPLSGSNEANVDDIGNDGDTTYNASTSTGTKDQIAHSDALGLGPLALQPVAMCRAVPPGFAKFRLGVLSGATEDVGSDIGVLEDYAGAVGDIYETDPNTSSPWTIANADAAETVIEHRA